MQGKKVEKDGMLNWLLTQKNIPSMAEEFHQLMNNELPKNWNENIPQFPADAKGMATRDASGKVMQAINPSSSRFYWRIS